jgi:hypothetical protein
MSIGGSEGMQSLQVCTRLCYTLASRAALYQTRRPKLASSRCLATFMCHGGVRLRQVAGDSPGKNEGR